MAKVTKRKEKTRTGSSEGIEDLIIPIEEIDPWLRILVYGRNGKGKTRFAASAPRPLILDINEKGTKSAREFKGAGVLPIREWEDLDKAYWYLKKGDHPYESVVIDTLTSMQMFCQWHILGEAVDRDPNRDPQHFGKQQWGALADLMGRQIYNFRNLPMHVIFTAQEREVGDRDAGEEIRFVPAMSPAPRGIAMGAVDIIGRIYRAKRRVKTKKGKKVVWESRLFVGDHSRLDTKDRTYSLGQILQQPTVNKIIEAAGLEEG